MSWWWNRTGGKRWWPARARSSWFPYTESGWWEPGQNQVNWLKVLSIPVALWSCSVMRIGNYLWASRLELQNTTNKAIQLQTHPNIDKELFKTRSVIGLKNPAKPFPVNTGVGVLKWRWKIVDKSSTLWLFFAEFNVFVIHNYYLLLPQIHQQRRLWHSVVHQLLAERQRLWGLRRQHWIWAGEHGTRVAGFLIGHHRSKL